MAGAINHLVVQGYYYLYALYFDYPINNAWFLDRESQARLRERLRVAQPLLALYQPYRKSWALRLFTERRSVERFPSELINEAYRQLRQVLEHIGPVPERLPREQRTRPPERRIRPRGTPRPQPAPPPRPRPQPFRKPPPPIRYDLLS